MVDYVKNKDIFISQAFYSEISDPTWDSDDYSTDKVLAQFVKDWVFGLQNREHLEGEFEPEESARLSRLDKKQWSDLTFATSKNTFCKTARKIAEFILHLLTFCLFKTTVQRARSAQDHLVAHTEFHRLANCFAPACELSEAKEEELETLKGETLDALCSLERTYNPHKRDALREQFRNMHKMTDQLAQTVDLSDANLIDDHRAITEALPLARAFFDAPLPQDEESTQPEYLARKAAILEHYFKSVLEITEGNITLLEVSGNPLEIEQLTEVYKANGYNAFIEAVINEAKTQQAEEPLRILAGQIGIELENPKESQIPALPTLADRHNPEKARDNFISVWNFARVVVPTDTPLIGAILTGSEELERRERGCSLSTSLVLWATAFATAWEGHPQSKHLTTALDLNHDIDDLYFKIEKALIDLGYPNGLPEGEEIHFDVLLKEHGNTSLISEMKTEFNRLKKAQVKAIAAFDIAEIKALELQERR